MEKTGRKSYNSTSQQSKVDMLALDRADSLVTKLCDLHVYKVPVELWRHSFNNILNNVITETVSVGIIRVPAELKLADVREEIGHQLAVHPGQLVPEEYVFLRSVGRSLTALRGHQEGQLKAKHFVPPVAYAPELYILEATPEVKEALEIRDNAHQSPVLSPGASPSRRNSFRDKDRRRQNEGSHTRRQSPPGDHRSRQRDSSESPGRKTAGRHSERRISSESSDGKTGRPTRQRGRPRPGERGNREVSTHGTSSDEDGTSTGSRWPGAERDKNLLKRGVDEARQEKLHGEQEKEDMLKRAKQVRRESTKQRNQDRETWKKRYFEEKKRTAPLEEMSGRLENELNALRAKQLSFMEGPKEKSYRLTDGTGQPSEKNNYVIQCTRLQHEIEEIQRRVDKTRTRLTAEIKLRVQAQSEMKVVRADAMQNRAALRAARTHPGVAVGVQS